MPYLLRMYCQGAMVIAPAFLILLILPIVEWEVDGHRMSYADQWLSGEGIASAAALVFISVGTWGLAARKRASRWLLVFSPVVPSFLLAISPGAPTVETIASTVVTAIVFYFCLFHIRTVCEYLDAERVGA